jgi:hypothetical protein
MDRIENDTSNNSSIIACIFVAAVTFISSRFLAKIGRYTYRHTDRWEGFMKYAAEMGSGAMIYIPNFVKIGSGIRKLIEGVSQTHWQHGDRVTLLLFFKIRKIC